MLYNSNNNHIIVHHNNRYYYQVFHFFFFLKGTASYLSLNFNVTTFKVKSLLWKWNTWDMLILKPCNFDNNYMILKIQDMVFYVFLNVEICCVENILSTCIFKSTQQMEILIFNLFRYRAHSSSLYQNFWIASAIFSLLIESTESTNHRAWEKKKTKHRVSLNIVDLKPTHLLSVAFSFICYPRINSTRGQH